MKTRTQWSGAPVLLSIFAISCGGAEGLNAVHGKVTFNGEPAAGALVTFQSEGPPPTGPGGPLVPSALVGSDGTFTLSCGDGAPGAPPGRYKVLILWRQGLAADSLRAQAAPPKGKGKSRGRVPAQPPPRADKHDLSPPDRLGGRYSSPDKTPLTAEVKPGPNNLPPFDLTD